MLHIIMLHTIIMGEGSLTTSREIQIWDSERLELHFSFYCYLLKCQQLQYFYNIFVDFPLI